MTDSWDHPWPPEQDRETIERVDRVDHDLDTLQRVRLDDVRWLASEHRRMRLTILRLRTDVRRAEDRARHLLTVLHPPALAEAQERARGSASISVDPCPKCGERAVHTFTSDGDAWDCPWCGYDAAAW